MKENAFQLTYDAMMDLLKRAIMASTLVTGVVDGREIDLLVCMVLTVLTKGEDESTTRGEQKQDRCRIMSVTTIETEDILAEVPL